MDEIFRFPDERVYQGDTFRCRKCRVFLIAFENLSPFHKKIEPVEQCSAWYINSDEIDDGDTLAWVKEAIDQSQWTEGKLYCPKCTSRIGSFNFTQGVRCSCFAFIIPAIWIQKCKVDQISTSDSKPNIRVPENPDNNADRSSGPQGGSPMFYLQTRQTGSPSDQTGFNTGSTGSHSGQTGFNTGSTGIQSGQSGSDSRSTETQSGQTGFNSGSTGTQSGQSGFGSGPSGSQISKGICSKQKISTTTISFKSTYVQNNQLPLDSSNKDGTRQHSTDSKQTKCSKCLHEVSGRCLHVHGDVHNYNPSNSQKCTIEFLGGTMDTKDSHNYGLDFSYKTKIGACGIHRRRSKQMKISTETTDDQTLSAMENIEDLLDNQLDRLETNGSRFELLKELEKDLDQMNKTETTPFKIKHLQEPHEAEEIPERVTCPVCLDLLYEPLVCPCSHVFCDSCLRLINSKSRHRVPRCPLCRKSLHYVYPAVDLREEIRNSYPSTYKQRHKVERRAPHRRLPLPNGRMRPRQKRTNGFPDLPMPYSVLMVLGCAFACCVLCLVILFAFCPPARNRCITIIGYEWMNG